MIDFPATTHAMAARHAAFPETAPPGRDRPIAERQAWRRDQAAAVAVYRALVAAYAAELLPALLGDAWQPSDRSLWGPAGRHGARQFVAGAVCGTTRSSTTCCTSAGAAAGAAHLALLRAARPAVQRLPR